MPFIEELLSYRSLSIVGLEKNTGKTECLNYILKRLPFEKRVAVSSIGLDGEQVDQVTSGSKPEIFLKEGTLFTTSEKHYKERKIISEILDISNERTSLGRLITARALYAGKVILSGPSTTASLSRWIEFIQKEYDVEHVIIDGALSRLSIASPAVTESMILATGASLSADINTIIQETAFTIEMVELPVSSANITKDLVSRERGMWHINEDGEQIREYDINKLNFENELSDVKNKRDLIYLAGALTDRFLNTLISRMKERELEVVVKDFTKIFVKPLTYRLFIKKGGRISVLYRSKLLAVTVNPLSPKGLMLDSDEIAHRLKDLTNIPVFDIFKDGFKV